ncbi:MAG: hypothetical protein AAGC64_12680 [Bacteroidota bacterium]
MKLLKSKYCTSFSKLSSKRKIKSSPTLIILLGLLVLTSCENDDSDDASANNGEEAEQAWMLSFSENTPQGNVYYMGVYDEIPDSPDKNTAIELGFNATSVTFGDNVYTWNSNAMTMTKWSVDKVTLSLTPQDILSFASVGVNDISPTASIISNIKAYMSNLAEGILVEFNPEKMEIVEVHQVEPYDFPGLYLPFLEWRKYISGNKIIIPLGYYNPDECCNWPNPDGAAIAVIDTDLNTVTYKKDNRLMAQLEEFGVDDEGDFYTIPATANPFFNEFSTAISDPLPQHTILKVNSDGEFVDDFTFDLDNVLLASVIKSVIFISGNEAIVQYADTSYSIEQPYDWAYWGEEYDNLKVVNFETGAVRDWNALPNYAFVGYNANINGEFYFRANRSDGGDLVRLNSLDDFTIVSRLDNGLIWGIGKLW